MGFTKAYQQLNPAQKQAVDEIDGPVMVIAGPGTGKTQVLTTRIANILKQTDTDPHSILALTYTESAATNMRERLVKLIGKEGHYVQIATFHAFCSEVIAEHSEYFSLSSEAKPLSDLERYEYLTQSIEQLDLDVLKPLNDPFHHLRDINSRISELKRENINQDKFAQLIEAEQQLLENDELKTIERKNLQKKIAKNLELVKIYDHYQKSLTTNQRYDFEDMIRLVVNAFSTNEDLLLEYQENLHYFLVDEYQDTNSAQNQVVDLLASYWSEKPNIFVVGDPNQSIFRFQGASVENALAFADKYPQAKIITLTTGYRCPQPIYDLAHQLIKQNHLTQSQNLAPNLSQTRISILKELDKKLVGKKSVQPIAINIAPSKTAEIIYLAQQIKSLVNQGTKLQEIAVLYHDNADAELVKEVLSKWELNFNVLSSNDVLANEQIRQLISLFQLIQNLDQDDRELNVFEVLSYRWLNTNTLDLMKLAKIANLHRLSLLECLDQGYLQVATDCQKYFLSEESFTHLVSKLELLRNLKIDDANLPFTEWFETTIKKTGFLDFIKNLPNSLELITFIKTIFDQIKNLNQVNKHLKLKDFLRALDLMTDYHLTIKAENIKLSEDAIHLSTVHKAKGQEWNYVFVVGLEDKKWGNRRKNNHLDLPSGIIKIDLEKKDRDEDDRRLFYVALTRAKKELFLSAAKTYLSANQEKSRPPSIFLAEIFHPTLIKTQEIEVEEKLLAKLIDPPRSSTLPKTAVRDFFAELVKGYQLTVSDLKIYLHDQQEFVEKVLLRLPSAKAPFFAYGTAIHGALEFLYSRYLQSGKFPPLSEVHDSFRYHLEKEILLPDEFARRLKKGQAVLAAYYEENQNLPSSVFGLEKRFGGYSHPIIIANDIYLSGRIDRLDWIDEQKKLVKVVDYKTGKQKTVNEIEGKVGISDYSERELALPENIRGHYKRQLLFYKLLIENDRSLKLKVSHGVFEFVEPKDNGKFVTRLFELHDDDVTSLKELIVQVMIEIRNLEFLPQLSLFQTSDSK